MKTDTLPDLPAVDEPETSRPRLQLSITQVIASGLAAITATLTARYLGLSGSVVGAALASVMTVSGSAIYAHSIARTRQRVLPGAPLEPPVAPAPVIAPPGVALRRFGLACVGLFLVVLGVIAGAQLVSGRPVDQVLRDGASTSSTVTTHPTQVVTEVVVPTTVTVTTTATASPSAPAQSGSDATTSPTPTATATPAPTASATQASAAASPTPTSP